MTREEAIEVLQKNKPTSDPRRCGKDLCEACDMAIAALQEPERKHGQWEKIRDPYGNLEEFIHTECGYCSKIASNYCPHCGAIMDGGVEE